MSACLSGGTAAPRGLICDAALRGRRPMVGRAASAINVRVVFRIGVACCAPAASDPIRDRVSCACSAPCPMCTQTDLHASEDFYDDRAEGRGPRAREVEGAGPWGVQLCRGLSSRAASLDHGVPPREPVGSWSAGPSTAGAERVHRRAIAQDCWLGFDLEAPSWGPFSYSGSRRRASVP